MRRAAVLLALLAALACPAPASAAWSAGARTSSSATAQAEAMPAGLQPVVSVSGRDVTVSWTQVSYHGGVLGQLATGGYLVRRYASGSQTASVPGASCNTLVTGTTSTLSCTERGVAPGSYQYAALPAFQSWTGTGAQSAAVTVGAPTLSISSPTTFSSLPTTLNGTLSGFLDSEAVTYHLDSATGTALTGTPATTPSSGGSSSAAVTIPAGTSIGVHTIYAVGASGSQATAQVSYAPAPTATTLAIANGGGTSKKPDAGDTITITYSQAMDVSTFCSTWLDDTTNQSLTTATVQLVPVGTSSTKIQVSAVSGACGGTFTLGTIDGLSKKYTATTIEFTSSRIDWTASTNQLQITLGTPSGTITSVTTSSTATYTPASGLLSTYGAAISTASKPTQSAILF